MRKTEKLIVWLIAITMMFFFAGPCFAGSAKVPKRKKKLLRVNINTATEKELLEIWTWDVIRENMAEGKLVPKIGFITNYTGKRPWARSQQRKARPKIQARFPNLYPGKSCGPLL